MVKNPPANAGDARDMGWIPGLERPPWRRKWQPSPVFFSGESHGQGSPMGYSPWGCTESHKTEQLGAHTRTRTHTHTHVDKDHLCSFPTAAWSGITFTSLSGNWRHGRDLHPVPASHRLDPLPVALNDHDSVKSHLKGKAGHEL